MTFEDILNLLNDTTKTRYQLAADIHALISKATAPSALNIKPKLDRAKRGPNKAKESGKVNVLGVMLDSGANGADHEAH
jgi:hypothetical protein